MNAEDIQPVIEIGAEQAVGHHPFQVAVGGGDDPHVGLDGRVAADALEAAFLEHAEHLALHQGRHVADFVEEERAAARLLELAHALAVGPGEGALFMAEQFGLQQGFGNGGAVDGQKLGRGPRTMLLDCPGHQFLARAALAQDQDVDLLAATRPMAL